ncbi:glycosyltransferase family protein, partial [Rhodospirillum rubrum]
MTTDQPGFRRAWRRRLREGDAADPPLVIFVVTSTRSDRLAGDWFTALELGRALEKRFCWRWRCIARDSAPTQLAEADIVVHMLHDVDIRTFRPPKPGALVVGWMRNWFNLWPSVSWIDDFDLLLASSERARAFVSAATALPCGLLRIATDPERFAQGHPDPALASEVLFTGSYWGTQRGLAQSARPADWPGRFAIYGKNWEEVAGMGAHGRGPLPYERLPDAYASTTLVLDDANAVTAPWGSVNSRVFDALAAGRLVLSNGALGAQEIFGDALPCFSGAEELTALVRSYLTDEAARQAKVATLRAMVLAGHTYAHRAEEFRAQIAALVGGLRLSIKTDREPGHPDRPESDAALQNDGQIRALSRALKTRGHMVRVDALAQWTRAAGRLDDAALIVRGEARFPYDLGIPLLIWACSHPTRVSPDEAAPALAVFEPGWADQDPSLPGALSVPLLAPVP